MSAPMRMIVRQAVQTGGLVAQRCRQPCLCACATAQAQYQQVRWKKGAGRYKAPPTEKVKEKWVPRSAKILSKVKVLPKNHDEFMARVPVDDVWMRAYYPKPKCSFIKAVQMHKELASPEMMDHLDAFLYLDVELDMRTKKKTKFMGNIRSTVVLPHTVDDGFKNDVIVFCRSADEKELAESMGAVFAGGQELIKMIEKGEVKNDDYNHALCTTDMFEDILGLRKHLRDAFPNKKKGSIGSDLEQMLTYFLHGKTYETTKESDAVGALSVIIGRLNMPEEHLAANFHTYVDSICSLRHKDLSKLGPFITKGIVHCSPSNEKFQLADEDLLPMEQGDPDDVKELAKVDDANDEEDDEEHKEEAAVS